MQQSENEKITARFFEALYALKAKGVIRGKKTFTDRYNINRWNLNALEAKNPNTTQNVKLNHYIAVFERVVLLCKICEQQTSNRIESLAIESGCIRG